MKVDDLLHGPQGLGKNRTVGNSAPTGTVDFQKLLEEQLQRASAPAASAGLGETAAIGAAAPVSPALRIEGLSLTETAIDTLDSFGAALADKHLAGADLGAYADAMEEGVIGLMAIRDQLPPGDQLGQVLERVATVSYLEAAKYRRGDYSV